MTSESFFEQIQLHFDANLPFVIYRKPNDAIIKGMLQKDDVVYTVDDFSEKGFVFAPFDTTHDTILIPDETSEFITLKAPSVVSDHAWSEKKDLNESARTQHVSLVQKGIEAIAHNIFLKVVLSRSEAIGLTQKNPIAIFKRLLDQYPDAFVYCWFHPKIGLWLGASPETLLKLEGTRFKTMALAGTQVYKGTLDVVWQNKELDEQQHVTNFIIDSLKGKVQAMHVSEPLTVKAGHLLHIRTNISGTLNSGLKEVLLKLHPTPAVCGMPKQKAKKFIIEHENYDREFYTGFFGELNLKMLKSRNPNKRNIENNAYTSMRTITDLFVNLRCMQLKTSHAHIYVGGGITKDSIPENEWQETVNKTQTIKSVLD